MTQALLHQHQRYMTRARTGGARILGYRTPCCDASLDTTVPKTSETWDSLVTCPYCNRLFMKVCRRDEVKAFLPPCGVVGDDVTEKQA